MAGCLEGIRVVDFTQVISGPFATYELALQGADVIKIEQPGAGDQGRQLMNPPPDLAAAGQSSLFAAFNAAKRSMTLDLKHDRAREVIERLVADADVFVENFKAGTMQRMGFGPDEMRAINPKLVYCSISGYGDSGPRAAAAAYDPAIQATSGMMSLTGFEGVTGPTKVGFWVTDMATGMTAAFAISSALAGRGMTGEGRYVDVSMLDTAVAFIAPMVLNYLNTGTEPRLMGNGSPGGSAISSVYPAEEGFLQISPATQKQFEALCRTLGRADLIENPLFAARLARLEHAEALREEIISALASAPALEWESRLAEAGVPAAAVATVPEMLANPQVVHRQVIAETAPAEGLTAQFKTVGAPFKVDRTSGHPAVPPPAHGQHTDEILRSIGYDDAAIEDLRAGGVV